MDFSAWHSRRNIAIVVRTRSVEVLTMKRFVVLPCLLAACATTNGRDAVMSRAPFDLDCPKESIQVQELGDRTFGAEGCGRKATYVTNRCWSGDFNGCKAVLNSHVSGDGVASEKPASQ